MTPNSKYNICIDLYSFGITIVSLIYCNIKCNFVWYCKKLEGHKNILTEWEKNHTATSNIKKYYLKVNQWLIYSSHKYRF